MARKKTDIDELVESVGDAPGEVVKTPAAQMAGSGVTWLVTVRGGDTAHAFKGDSQVSVCKLQRTRGWATFAPIGWGTRCKDCGGAL